MKTLFKVAVPLLMMAVAALVARRRNLSWRDDVGLCGSPAGVTVLWVAVYVAWMLGTNAAIGWRGPWDFAPWRSAPWLVDIGRIVAVSLLGPIAEELLFRGVLFGWLRRVRVPVVPTVLVVAVLWAALHWTYSPLVIALLFVDGLLLGAARHQTRSLVAPMLMHVAWNLYAIW
jgi:membrane protease YdiL (CAAX protease family)